MIRYIGDGGHAKVCRECQAYGSGTFIAVGDNADRKREAAASHDPAPVLIHHTACVSPRAHLGPGTVVMAGAIVQADARIGDHCIVNTGASVDHDCIVGDFAHIAPGAHLCGGVVVGEGALVGVGVGIEPGTIIPAWSIVKRERYEITLRRHAAA